MARILTTANQKGGVGKTTTAVNLAAGLARRGLSVLLIDLDPQSNATLATLGSVELPSTVYDVLKGGELQPAIRAAEMGFDVLPASLELAAAERDLWGLAGGQMRLQRAIALAKPPHDWIIIDAPPSLGALTLNALAAAQSVLVPVSASFFALQGLQMLQSTIDDVRQFLNADALKIAGLLVTFADQTNVARDVEALLRSRFGELVYRTTIPRNVKLEEAHSRRASIFDYDPTAAGALAYDQFVDEVIQRDKT